MEVGATRKFAVGGVEPSGEYSLSLKPLHEALAWRRLRQVRDVGAYVCGKVVGSNRGGLIVEVENLRGFTPSSHIGIVRARGRGGFHGWACAGGNILLCFVAGAAPARLCDSPHAGTPRRRQRTGTSWWVGGCCSRWRR